jgi:DNA-binding transcriptional LysR family regulator
MLHVLPKLPTLRARFPDVVLDLSTEEGLVDIVSGSYDAGIRHGERVAQDMVAVRIGPDYRTAVVASPSYIFGAPALHAPADLIRHSALAYRLPTSGALLRWEFSRNGHKFAIDVRPVFIANNNEAIVRAAVDGLGVAYLLREQVSDELKRGALVELLPDWSMSYEACYLYYPDRRQVRPAMRAVIDVLRYDG